MSGAIEMTINLKEERYMQAQMVLMAMRAVSDLLLNQIEGTDSMGMVKPENLQALMDILADQLDAALVI